MWCKQPDFPLMQAMFKLQLELKLKCQFSNNLKMKIAFNISFFKDLTCSTVNSIQMQKAKQPHTFISMSPFSFGVKMKMIMQPVRPLTPITHTEFTQSKFSRKNKYFVFSYRQDWRTGRLLNATPFELLVCGWINLMFQSAHSSQLKIPADPPVLSCTSTKNLLWQAWCNEIAIQIIMWHTLSLIYSIFSLNSEVAKQGPQPLGATNGFCSC